ncbi:hypothetical protein Bca4012_037134 [Brassica carinata]|uniref:Uncharacterized protein n=1 Tax=Brassica carinata TaxID=52824 RepID=A0A8X7WC49_BRACI|nr:hypothetical protein Bca52824_010826 [Brassica carinata]
MVNVHLLSLEIAKARNTIDLNVDPPYGFGFADRTLSDEYMWLDAYIREEDYVKAAELIMRGCAFTSGKYFSNVQVNPVVDLECGNKSLESVGLQGSSTDSSGGADFGSHVNNLSLKKVPNFVGSENNGHNPHFEKGESSKIMANENTEANDPMDSSGTDFSMRAAPPLNLCLTITGSGEQGGSRTPINLEDSASDVGVGKGGC